MNSHTIIHFHIIAINMQLSVRKQNIQLHLFVIFIISTLFKSMPKFFFTRVEHCYVIVCVLFLLCGCQDCVVKGLLGDCLLALF